MPTKLTIYHSCDEHDLPIVIDSGASVTITPILKDFVASIRPSNLTSLQDISARTNVEGEGTLCWTIRGALGQVRQLRTKAYYVTGAKIHLFSTQQYFEESNNDILSLNKSGTKLGLNNGSILLFPFQKDSRLPVMITDHHFKQRECPVAGLTFQETLAFTSNKYIFTRIADETTNQNISYAQKELLLWHHRLCHFDLQIV
jgi:hypothetical protein